MEERRPLLPQHGRGEPPWQQRVARRQVADVSAENGAARQVEWCHTNVPTLVGSIIHGRRRPTGHADATPTGHLHPNREENGEGGTLTFHPSPRPRHAQGRTRWSSHPTLMATRTRQSRPVVWVPYGHKVARFQRLHLRASGSVRTASKAGVCTLRHLVRSILIRLGDKRIVLSISVASRFSVCLEQGGDTTVRGEVVLRPLWARNAELGSSFLLGKQGNTARVTQLKHEQDEPGTANQNKSPMGDSLCSEFKHVQKKFSCHVPLSA